VQFEVAGIILKAKNRPYEGGGKRTPKGRDCPRIVTFEALYFGSEGCWGMETPTEYYGVFDASSDAEDAEIRSSYRAAFIGAVLVLVPLAVLIVTKTEAESIKKGIAHPPRRCCPGWRRAKPTRERF
jgi:hypothetical protein